MMLGTFVEEHGIYYIIGAVCLIGMLGKWYEGRVYKRLLRALDSTDRMEHPLVKQLRLKYMSCQRLDYEIHNVDAFVENQLYRYKYRFISLERLNGIAGRMMLLCIMAACAGVGICVYEKLDIRLLMYHIVAGALGVAMLEWSELQFGCETKRKMIFVALKDYLENIVANHRERGKHVSHLKEEPEDKQEQKNNAGSQVAASREKAPARMGITPAMEKTAEAVAKLPVKSQAQEKVIADVIQEFFP